tara:strand:- start:4656 stop:5603 length:948 start_codon:yes stop_codon:yes gene_type:complete
MKKNNNFGFFLKTYIDDYFYVERLIKSFNFFNAEDIKMILMCPKADLNEFLKFKSKNINIIEDEILEKHLFKEKDLNKIPYDCSLGYLNQQILKLSFWELGIFKNYFCLDSEVVFIKNFQLKDFMKADDVPYTFLVEDNELKVDKEYYQQYWEGRHTKLKIIKEFVGLNDHLTFTTHNNTTFSSLVLKSMVKQFSSEDKTIYKDLILISPYEFSWYNFWLQKSEIIPIYFREPIIKMFHIYSQYLNYLRRGISIDDIKRGYSGYLINSNFSRASGPIKYGELSYVPGVKEIKNEISQTIKLIRNKVKHTIFKRLK